MTDNPAADLVIYGSPVSPFVRKVAATCIEKGAAFEIEPVNVFDPPEWFREISPMKRIPVLRDRSIATEGPDGTIADSSAICSYIERKHPAPSLYCSDAYAHGRALMIEEYADTVLAATGGLGIFRPIFFAVSKGEEPDLEKARLTWAEDMPPILGFLDRELEGRTFCCEETVSIADLSIACILMQIYLVAELPLGDYPALAAHFERMRGRPSIAGPFAKADGFIRKTLPDRFNLT